MARIASGSDWSFEDIERFDAVLAELAAGFGLDTYPNQIEVITAEQMMDAYSTVGLPVGYAHWSFGKRFVEVENRYRRGEMSLAYELVINSNPCIVYLMEENTLTMQALVLAHAAYGHNAFFKGNYLFQTWTQADSIIDYLVFARDYVRRCEQRHGEQAVESLLDACHALMNYGVDRYKRPPPLSAQHEAARQAAREAHLQAQINELWRTLPVSPGPRETAAPQRFPPEPEENLLYFIEKNAPLLEPWEREIVRIVRKLAQYFYPQRQTKVMNEGWACFWHYTLMNALYEGGYVDEGFMLEFITAHTNVIAQPPYDHPGYFGINPYALGFAMMRDIQRICESPEDEDREWFPEIAGSDWRETLDFAMRNFKDESFIRQYLSPRLMREFRLFALLDDDQREAYEVTAIHDARGYAALRNALAAQYDLGCTEPDIQVWDVDVRGDRTLTLRHHQRDRRPLGETTRAVMRHLRRLWQFPVRLESVDEQGRVKTVCRVE
ncbi:MAG: SpoVR family protein [Gammaproteobacteria bacterium]|nr:MAG: SpoVR family protein [Gammaproteobacteria bacterium]